MERRKNERLIIPASSSLARIRARIRVTGTVQGVGFRPFVYKIATELGLSGFVCNQGGSVEIEVQAQKASVEAFLQRLNSEAPPVAKITDVEIIEIEEICADDAEMLFEIVSSKETNDTTNVEIPPDIATCSECVSELFNSSDRRFLYPFLNCTNCGPRFTVIRALPYDRRSTSLSCFPMCEDCNFEYKDPRNRRFHAQPSACSRCGPALAFIDLKTDTQADSYQFEPDDNALTKALASLAQGNLLAIKSLGGFQLCCDATNDSAVSALRHRKRRNSKPFAVMFPSDAQIDQYCHLSALESAILKGQFRPIVLLKRRSNPTARTSPADSLVLSNLVAPGLKTLGVMVPYTPLHHLLLNAFGKPLIMTSGNLSEEPIAAGNREAFERLTAIADAFLINNRDITSRYDDTVTRVVLGEEMVIRRARGYAPRTINLPFHASAPILALGGHQKNTFCLVKDNKAYVSQHIGDLDSLETIEHFEKTLLTFLQIFEIKPEILGLDMHPDYGSTKLAEAWLDGSSTSPFEVKNIKKTIPVQHHHAHIASCMAEHGIVERVIGVAFDGIGYGADKKLWGGEILSCDYANFQRMASFKNVPMPGGERAIREPWRMALSYLATCSAGVRESKAAEQIFNRFSSRYGKQNVSTVYFKLADSHLSPRTSSCGRLFDGVSALLGLCEVSEYEGQAAVILESSAADCDVEVNAYPVITALVTIDGKELIEIDTTSVVEAVINDIDNGISDKLIAARFHETIAKVVQKICLQIRTAELNTICLSGGVFQNEILLSRCKELLISQNFRVFNNNRVPANDGGLSLGQAAIALARSASG